MRQSLALVLLLLALPAVAQIYKYTDANGNTAFSSQPPDGTKVETVDLPPLNSVGDAAPAPPTSAPSQSQTPPQPASATYETLRLTDLPNDEALRANNGSFIAGVMIQPRLQPGHLLQLLVDGKPYGQPTNVPRVQVTELDRGEHSLSVQVVQGAQIIQQSETINLTVQRAHVGKR
ncbi:DUF4124 domain-containing protein [Pseudomonas sp. LP_7_YM]|uniref:DUF4124 domain-containing protein n=1 Tax=Pseudomonas sp. LP_7_YM TaxID=2485137 RepID=UPI00105B5CC3|nr:DUF4124 domain-containing protein [Pseudomonas sp. LP_7_YM]TDV60589.1 uncharacterized protein DUF4124 [Pseudomonas sp. LP_7_YM]